MITDAQLLFSDEQAITADADSTNVVDLSVAGMQFEDAVIKPFLVVDEVFDNLTSLKVSLVTDDNASLTSDTIVWSSREILLAELVAGARISLPALNNLTGSLERYIGIQYDVTGTAPTTGKITCGLVAGGEHSNLPAD